MSSATTKPWIEPRAGFFYVPIALTSMDFTAGGGEFIQQNQHNNDEVLYYLY